MNFETALKIYKEPDNKGYKVVQFAKDVQNGTFTFTSAIEMKKLFSQMLNTNYSKYVYVSKSVGLYENTIFKLGLSFFNSVEKIDKFFEDNKKQDKKCSCCNSNNNVANFCFRSGMRRIVETENFDKEFIEICRKAKFAVNANDHGVAYICRKCFTKILTKAYINFNNISVDAIKGEMSDLLIKSKAIVENSNKNGNGCLDVNKEYKKESKGMNEKFAKINNVTTATDGQLAIVKDGVAYILTEDNQLVAVAASVTPDRAYASIRVVANDVKERDIVLDPCNGNPVFVEKTEGTRITFRDVINATSVVRDFVPDEITGEATVTKLISVIKLVRSNRNVLPIINRYGKDTVFEVMVNQYLSYGDVDATRIEAEINPTMIQLDMTRSMKNMTDKVGELVDKLGDKE